MSRHLYRMQRALARQKNRNLFSLCACRSPTAVLKDVCKPELRMRSCPGVCCCRGLPSNDRVASWVRLFAFKGGALQSLVLYRISRVAKLCKMKPDVPRSNGSCCQINWPWVCVPSYQRRAAARATYPLIWASRLASPDLPKLETP